MVVVFAKIFSFVMGIIYSLLKLKKTDRNKVTFISRQSDEISEDFSLITNALKREHPEIKICVLCKVIPKSFIGRVGYVFHMLLQMNAMATSHVVVLDGYCIMASLLKHKDELTVIQLWHALGAFKRFGRSILDLPGGNSSKTANAFKMHNNYDLIAASGEKCVPYFSEAFGQPYEKFIPIGLPRMDNLVSKNYREQSAKAVYEKYPFLGEKKLIVYAPTFRDSEEDTKGLRDAEKRLAEACDYENFNLAIKRHPVDTGLEIIYTREGMITGKNLSTIELMAAADAVVTDYSSVIYEALLMGKDVYMYCFDGNKYITDRGFYIDFYKDIPAVFEQDAKKLYEKIAAGEKCETAKVQQFKSDYIEKKFDSITDTYSEIISEICNNNYDGRFNYRGQGNGKN